MQRDSHPPIALPAPITIPSAPIPPQHQLTFRTDNHVASEPAGSTSYEPPNKRRKKERACDYCRRRKIKCDGPSRQDQTCTNCIHSHRRCTYVELSKPRGPPKAYVTALEDRMERLEGIVEQLCPGTDFSKELGPPVIRGSWRNSKPHQFSHPSSASISQPSSSNPSPPPSISIIPKAGVTVAGELDLPTSSLDRSTHLIFKLPQKVSHRSSHVRRCATSNSSPSTSLPEDSSSESSEETLVTGPGGRHKLTLISTENANEAQPSSCIRFHGRSSTASLVEVTRRFKFMSMQERSSQEHVRDEQEGGEEGDLRRTAPRSSRLPNKPDNEKVRACRRFQFWSAPKWELEWEGYGKEAPHLVAAVLNYFPPDDVAHRLFDLFFCHTNTYLPLLHRPTFERYWHQRLHHSNIWFAVVCISMFAVASRWYESDGLVDDSPTEKEDWKAAGWRWFFVALEVHCIQRSIICSATLFEVQTLALMTLFLRGTTCIPIGWLFTSIAIKKAQDRGAHRKSVYEANPNANDELWKRAFWVLLAFDRILGASLGRGVMVGEEDYDLDLPLEVDDEYWETGNAETDFKQPPDIPSKMSAFTQFIKLVRIIGFTTKTLYPVDRSKVVFGFLKDGWTDEVVRQLKLTMQEWVESIPAHLRWSEDISNTTFSRQSATIHSLWHCVHMTIWRQFCVYNPAALLPHNNTRQYALSQCAVSIRSCARILDVDMRTGLSNTPNMINVALVCAGTMAMILWELQRTMVASGKGKMQIRAIKIGDTGIYLHELLDDVEVCMKVLESKRSRWEWAETVLNKLKDALPSDKDESFENLDIPMPSMDGINSNFRIPVDFDDQDLISNFQVLHDGTISFTGQRHQMDDIRPPPLELAKDIVPSSQHLRTGSSGQKDGTPLSHGFGQAQMGHPIPGVPHPQDLHFQTFSTSLSHRISTKQGQLAAHGIHHPSQHGTLRFIPHVFPETKRAPLRSESLFQPLDSQPFASSVHHPSFQWPDSQPSIQEPKFLQRFDAPRPDAPQDGQFDRRSVYGSNPMPPLQHHHPVRTRTTSLVNRPIPSSTAGGEILSPSSSLRRTSFPNLQLLRKGSQTAFTTAEDKSSTNVAVDTSYQGIAPPIERSVDVRHSSSSTSHNPSTIQSRGLQPSTSKPRLTDWDSDIACQVLGDNERNDQKTSRPTEFRHWNKHPLLPPSDLSEKDDSPRYTHHRFVHETPFSR